MFVGGCSGRDRNVMHAQTAQYFLFNCRSKPRRWENIQIQQLQPCSNSKEMLQSLKCFVFHRKCHFLKGTIMVCRCCECIGLWLLLCNICRLLGWDKTLEALRGQGDGSIMPLQKVLFILYHNTSPQHCLHTSVSLVYHPVTNHGNLVALPLLSHLLLCFILPLNWLEASLLHCMNFAPGVKDFKAKRLELNHFCQLALNPSAANLALRVVSKWDEDVISFNFSSFFFLKWFWYFVHVSDYHLMEGWLWGVSAYLFTYFI